MYYTFMWKNKNIKVVPDDLTFPAEYLFKYFYRVIIERENNNLLPLFLDYIFNNSQVLNNNFNWNHKYLNNVSLKREDMINPRIENYSLQFELSPLVYKEFKANNNLSYYDLNKDKNETFSIDLSSVALEKLKKDNKHFEVSYFENTFLTEGKSNENYKYINVNVPLFEKEHNIVGYYNNDFSDVETCFSAVAFCLASRNKKSNFVKYEFRDNCPPFPLKKSIYPNSDVKNDYVGLFKYYDNVGSQENPSFVKKYVKIPSKSILEKGKYFTFDCNFTTFYSLMDSEFKTLNDKINGIELLDYIRHHISASYKNYENVGVSDKKGLTIGYPRVLNIIQENSPYSLENSYLIPAPVYVGKKYEQEKQYDNSDNIFPDSLEKLINAKNVETITKYHHNRGLFFMESALDINSYYSNLDYNRTEPTIKLNKEGQLQLHYGKNDFIRQNGVLVPYIKKLPFKIGELNQAKIHARKVFQFKEKNYYAGLRKEIPTPWKYDDFDVINNEEDYSVSLWKENFLSQKNFDEWKNDFLEVIEDRNEENLYLIPLPKENSKDEQSIIDYAMQHISINHAWFCKIKDLENSLIEDINSNITSMLNKAFQYQNYQLDNSRQYIIGIKEQGLYNPSFHIFKIVNEEEFKELRKKVYGKWIENNICRNPLKY